VFVLWEDLVSRSFIKTLRLNPVFAAISHLLAFSRQRVSLTSLSLSLLRSSATLYPAVISLSRSIQLHLSLHQGLAPNPVHNPRSEAQVPEDRILRPSEGWEGDRVPPELGIMAVVVIVLKMVYGLDGRER